MEGCYNGVITSISIHQGTIDELKKLKVHPRETYEDIIVRLINKVRI